MGQLINFFGGVVMLIQLHLIPQFNLVWIVFPFCSSYSILLHKKLDYYYGNAHLLTVNIFYMFTTDVVMLHSQFFPF